MKVSEIINKERNNANSLMILDADKYFDFTTAKIPDFEDFKKMQLFGGEVEEFILTDLYKELEDLDVNRVYMMDSDSNRRQLCIAIKFNEDQLKKLQYLAPLKFTL